MVFRASRKRKRTNGFKRSFKRTRFIRKRRATKSSSYSTRSERASTFGYRAKKVSPRIWRKKLWDSTLQKPHYRSVIGRTDVVDAPASAILAASRVFQAMDNGIGPFWTAAGGAIDPDGGAVNTFDTDIILRGGRIGITFANQDLNATDNVNIDVYLYKSGMTQTFDGSGVLSSVRPIGWDPTMLPEQRAILGKMLMRRSFLLKSNEQMNVEFRVGIEKIDTSVWNALGGGRYYWLVVSNNAGNNNVTTVNCVMYHNLSFSADAT